jgi:hypothetical protein
LEDSYAAFGKIETRVDELGQQLEVEHARLDDEVKSIANAEVNYSFT